MLFAVSSPYFSVRWTLYPSHFVLRLDAKRPCVSYGEWIRADDGARNSPGRSCATPSTNINCSTHMRLSVSTAGSERIHPGAASDQSASINVAPSLPIILSVSVSVFRLLRQSRVIHSFPISINPLSRDIGAHPFWRGDGQDIERRMQCFSDTFQPIEIANRRQHVSRIRSLSRTSLHQFLIVQRR